MAAQHVRAVQRIRRQIANQLDYELLCIIATDIGRDGSPAITGYREMADRAACHFNTVGGHIESLKNDGWITIEKIGKYHHYSLTIDCDNDCDNHVKTVTNNCDNDERLSQVEERLSQLERTLSQLLSQSDGHIVTTDQTDTVTKEKEYKESKEEEKGKKEEDVDSFRLIPVEIATPEFLNAWNEWRAYREEINKPLTFSTMKAQLGELKKYPVSDIVAMIETSIRNGWLGLFPPDRGKANGRSSRPVPEPDETRVGGLY